MKKSSLLKSVLLSFVLSSCGSVVPDFPEVWQCVYKNNKFYCVNSKTSAKKIVTNMENAQCLSSSDYKKSERWVAVVRELAEQRCQ